MSYLDYEIQGKIAAIQRLASMGLTEIEICDELNKFGAELNVSGLLVRKVLGSPGSVSEGTGTNKQLLNEGE